MNRRMDLQQLGAFVLGLLLVGAVGLAVLNIVKPLSFDLPFRLTSDSGRADETFDYERAADISAMRWRAMAQFYNDHDMLTRDDFDYEKAADVMAMRWIEMAKFYEKHGMLNER